jgi:cytoskeleton protein RodZ
VTRGFVRNYARYLELDAEPLMQALGRVPMPQGPELVVGVSPSSVNMPREGRGDRRDYIRVLAGLMALVLALLAYFFVPDETWQSTLDSIKALVSENEAVPGASEEANSVSGEISSIVPAMPEFVSAATASVADAPLPITVTPSPVAVASPPAEELPLIEPAPTEPPAGPLARTPPAMPSASDGMLVFSFDQAAWIEVRDRDGRILHSQINQAGSQRELAGQPPFALVIGNASHVALRYKGKPIDLSQRSRDNVARLTLE